jgi:aspartate/methionine/tyrosine aminotransferase
MSGAVLPSLSLAATTVRKSVFAELQGHITAYRAAGGQLVPLHIGDTYLPPPAGPGMVAEEHELSVYGAVPGLESLREALAARVQARGFAAAESAANVHVGCGCTHALFCAARALLDPGDEVLVASPYWPLIMGVLHACGAVPVEVPLSWPLYREADFDVVGALERARTSRTRAIYIITPGNPDGQVYSHEQLQAIASFAREHGLWVIADEVYADFVYDGEHQSIARLEGMADRTVTGFSLSKSHGLAGARIGYVVASEPVIAAARRISNHTVYNVPVAMQRAALAAIEAEGDWVDRARESYREARDLAVESLRGLGLDVAVPRGGSFVFVDLASKLAGMPMRALIERGIDEGVLVAPGEAFGRDYASFARLCFTGVNLEQLREGMARFSRALGAMS